jgi:hypothetical protein
MQITVKKTDKRHTGSDRFKYYVDIKQSPRNWNETYLIKEKFYEIRQWCWETWGPAREVDQFNSRDGAWTEDQNPAWAWINDQHRSRIYLAGKEEAAYFTLKWS